MCSFLIKCNVLVKKCFSQNLKENYRQNNVCCVFLLLMSILGHRIQDFQGTKTCCMITTVRKNSSDEKGRNSLT